MNLKYFAVASALLTAACAAPAVISDINDSSLKVQANGFTPQSEIDAKAREGCEIYNKKPVPISERPITGGYGAPKEVLYACK